MLPLYRIKLPLIKIITTIMVLIVIPASCPQPNALNAIPLNTTVYPGQSLMYECKTGYALVAGDLSMPCSMVEPYVIKGTPSV